MSSARVTWPLEKESSRRAESKVIRIGLSRGTWTAWGDGSVARIWNITGQGLGRSLAGASARSTPAAAAAARDPHKGRTAEKKGHSFPGPLHDLASPPLDQLWRRRDIRRAQGRNRPGRRPILRVGRPSDQGDRFHPLRLARQEKPGGGGLSEGLAGQGKGPPGIVVLPAQVAEPKGGSGGMEFGGAQEFVLPAGSRDGPDRRGSGVGGTTGRDRRSPCGGRG